MSVALTEGLSAALRDLSDAMSDAERADLQGALLLSMATDLYRHRDAESLGIHIVSTALAMTHARRAALVRWDSVEQVGEVVYASRGHLVRPGMDVDATSVTGRACTAQSPLILENAGALGESARVYGAWEMPRAISALAIIPLRSGEQVTGAIVIEGDEIRTIHRDDSRNLQLLGHLVAASFEAVWAVESLDRRVHIDALTGLANRHHFEDRLRHVVAEAERFGGPVSLVVIDIDRLKHINDTYGEDAGNEVLRQMAQRLHGSVRAVDCCARYGGEEIALILPRTDHDGAMHAAERLRAGSAGAPYQVGEHSISLTVSVGVASFPQGARTADELVAAADRALYEAKRSGRDRVVSGGV